MMLKNVYYSTVMSQPTTMSKSCYGKHKYTKLWTLAVTLLVSWTGCGLFMFEPPQTFLNFEVYGIPYLNVMNVLVTLPILVWVYSHVRYLIRKQFSFNIGDDDCDDDDDADGDGDDGIDCGDCIDDDTTIDIMSDLESSDFESDINENKNEKPVIHLYLWCMYCISLNCLMFYIVRCDKYEWQTVFNTFVSTNVLLISGYVIGKFVVIGIVRYLLAVSSTSLGDYLCKSFYVFCVFTTPIVLTVLYDMQFVVIFFACYVNLMFIVGTVSITERYKRYSSYIRSRKSIANARLKGSEYDTFQLLTRD